jgi:hypothetical protein
MDKLFVPPIKVAWMPGISGRFLYILNPDALKNIDITPSGIPQEFSPFPHSRG